MDQPEPPTRGRQHATPPPLGEGKQALRLWARTARSQARAHTGSAMDEAVCEALRASALFAGARTVALYLPMGDEVNIEPLIGPERLFVAPRVQMQPTPHLTFHELGAGTEQHRWGLREPAPGARQVDPSDIDLVLVPGLLFDEFGGRLGYGKGFYDRFLARTQGATVGVTFDDLVLPRLPLAKHDVPVQHLVTETGLRPVRR